MVHVLEIAELLSADAPVSILRFSLILSELVIFLYLYYELFGSYLRNY